MRRLDVVVIGAGQTGLAVGYYLRRTRLSYVLLDASWSPGGAWPRTWPSLRLFSPAEASSLPGWLMPSAADGYPTRDEAIDYLTRYERRYQLPVRQPVRVDAVRRSAGGMEVNSDAGAFAARAVVSATGTAAAPHVPAFSGRESFRGRQIHSVDYCGPGAVRRRARDDRRRRQLGGTDPRRGLARGPHHLGHTRTAALHVRRRRRPRAVRRRQPPLPRAQRRRAGFRGARAGRHRDGRVRQGSAPPRRARAASTAGPAGTRRGRLAGRPVPAAGRRHLVHGFAPALDHLAPLGIVEPDGRVRVDGTRSLREPRLWLVGYGGWTGFASATLIGVGRNARRTVDEVARELAASPVSYARSG